MTKDKKTNDRDIIDQLVDPHPFIRASALAKLTPEGRRLLFRSLYEQKKAGETNKKQAAAKVAMNSTYAQSGWVDADELFETGKKKKYHEVHEWRIP